MDPCSFTADHAEVDELRPGLAGVEGEGCEPLSARPPQTPWSLKLHGSFRKGHRADRVVGSRGVGSHANLVLPPAHRMFWSSEGILADPLHSSGARAGHPLPQEARVESLLG